MSFQSSLFGWLFGKVVPLLDFFLFEILLTKRGAVAVLASALGYLGTRLLEPVLKNLGVPLNLWGRPLELCISIALLALLLASFALHKWFSYGRGPSNALYHVVFAGFFEPSGPEGSFARTGASKGQETEFLRTVRQALNEHRINSGVQIERGDERVDLPLRVVDYRPPRGFHAVRDVEGFERLARKFSSRCIGVVWGTVNEDGRIDRFEITINPWRYHGRDAVEPLFGRVGQVVEHQGLPPQTVVRYMARVLAATWGYSYCQMLNDLDKNRESLSVTADSRRLVEGALEELSDQGGSEAAAIADAQRRTLLPLILRQEAWSLLLDGQRERALERLRQALKVDLYSPFENSRAFGDYYNHSYAFEVQERADGFTEWVIEQHDEPPEWLGDVEKTAPRHGDRALVGLPVPNLRLFVNWIELALSQGSNISGLIDGWFAELAEAHPDDPFVLVHWGDALKVEAGPAAVWYAKPRLAKVDAAIRKYEAAYELDPSLSVLAVRLSTLYLVTSSFFKGTSEGKRRQNRVGYWAERGAPYYEEYLPSQLTSDTTEGEDAALMEWLDSKFRPGAAPG